jgi:hypothetical protein
MIKNEITVPCQLRGAEFDLLGVDQDRLMSESLKAFGRGFGAATNRTYGVNDADSHGICLNGLSATEED